LNNQILFSIAIRNFIYTGFEAFERITLNLGISYQFFKLLTQPSPVKKYTIKIQTANTVINKFSKLQTKTPPAPAFAIFNAKKYEMNKRDSHKRKSYYAPTF